MNIEDKAPPRIVTIQLVGSTDIATLKYLLEAVSDKAKQSSMWPLGRAILDKLVE